MISQEQLEQRQFEQQRKTTTRITPKMIVAGVLVVGLVLVVGVNVFRAMDPTTEFRFTIRNLSGMPQTLLVESYSKDLKKTGALDSITVSLEHGTEKQVSVTVYSDSNFIVSGNDVFAYAALVPEFHSGLPLILLVGDNGLITEIR